MGSGCAAASEFQGCALPAPEAREHSRALAALIRREVEREGGHISFERFMELALYEPGWGYYSAGAARFGAAGDFTTAPLISPLFSRCLAAQCEQVLATMPDGVILELGAGSGVMAGDLLLELERRNALPQRYLILETGADLRARQERLLQRRVPHLMGRFSWLDCLPQQALSGVMLANEVADALPVRRISIAERRLQEQRVACKGDNFYWTEAPADAVLCAAWEQVAADLDGPLCTPYRSEINLRLAAWVRTLAAALQRGVMVLTDYGYTRREFYHPQRMQGSLLCHYRQRAHDNPFFYPGLQDITASVDFTALAQAGLDAGLRLAGYTSQAHFLIACGLTGFLAEACDARGQPDPAVTGQAKQLTLPGEMGERCKAIAFARDFAEPLIGFHSLDQQARLWRHGGV